MGIGNLNFIKPIVTLLNLLFTFMFEEEQLFTNKYNSASLLVLSVEITTILPLYVTSIYKIHRITLLFLRIIWKYRLILFFIMSNVVEGLLGLICHFKKFNSNSYKQRKKSQFSETLRQILLKRELSVDKKSTSVSVW